MIKNIFVLGLALLFLFSPVVSVASTGSTEPGLVGYIFDFIVSIFIPPEGYFTEKIATLSNQLNAKLGGVSYLYQMLRNFFDGLRYPSAASLVMDIPQGYLFSGSQRMTANILTSAAPYLYFFRAVSTVALALFTAMACYRSLRGLFGGDGS